MELDTDYVEKHRSLLDDGEEDNAPPDINTPDLVLDIAYHPLSPFLAIGQVSGAVCIHEYKRNETRHLSRLQLHSSGITSMEFTESGSHLVTVSSDMSINILDCGTQKSIISVPAGKGNPHKCGLSTVNICSEVLVATGDDDGKICIWDMRTKKVAMRYHEHGDYISQMLFFSEINQIVSSSGDTCLGIYDMRAGGIIDYSEKRKDDLTCLAFVPETNDIICGTPGGTLPVWRYAAWRRPYDVYDKHPRECDTIQTYNDNIVITGAGDGIIRVLQIHPVKRNLCQLGGRDGLVRKERDTISKLCISHDRAHVAYCGTSNIVSFVNIEFLGDEKQLNQLRSKAEQRHIAVLKEATEEMEGKGNDGPDGVDGNVSGDSSDWTDSNDEEEEEDDNNNNVVKGSRLEVKRKLPAKSNVVGYEERPEEPEEVCANAEEEEEGDSDDSDDSDRPKKKTQRDLNRERASAARWLKEEKKKHVDFKFERRRRRVQGFWEDLK